MREAKNNLLPNHRSINTCIAVETDREPIIVQESGECSQGLEQEGDIVTEFKEINYFQKPI